MRVCVIGCGLIGGSIALALRDQDWPVVVYDQDPGHRRELKEQGFPVIDSAAELEPPDLFVVATPPGYIAGWVVDLLEQYPGSVITDTGSVKCIVDDQVQEKANTSQMSRWVPGHPLSGSPRSGFSAAKSDLFSGQKWLLCAQQGNGSAIGVVENMVRALGAEPALTSCERHDQLAAWSSHLPHVLSSALQSVASDEAGEELKNFAGTGFQKTSQLAYSDPWLWQGILMANQANVCSAIDSIQKQLQQVREILESSNQAELVMWLEQSAMDHKQLAESRGWGEPSLD